MPKRRAEPRWVGRVVVEAVHFDVVREHGGMPGVRDEHALEAALARPRQRFTYAAEADLADLAAAYGHGIASSDPFNDGNKRVAFVITAVFLGLNGLQLVASEADVVDVMLALAAGELDEAEFASWVRSHSSAPLTSRRQTRSPGR